MAEVPSSILIGGNIFTARKRSLEQGNIFRSVCQEFCSGWGGVVSQHALQVVSQHALQQGGWYPSMPYRIPGPHPVGEVEGSGLGLVGVSRPTPEGVSRPSSGEGLQAHTQVQSPGPHPGAVSRPTPRGCLQAHTWGVSRPTPRGEFVSQHALRQTPHLTVTAAGGTQPTGMHSGVVDNFCFHVGKPLMSKLPILRVNFFFSK